MRLTTLLAVALTALFGFALVGCPEEEGPIEETTEDIEDEAEEAEEELEDEGEEVEDDVEEAGDDVEDELD